jgi:hypothetical protein
MTLDVALDLSEPTHLFFQNAVPRQWLPDWGTRFGGSRFNCVGVV